MSGDKETSKGKIGNLRQVGVSLFIDWSGKSSLVSRHLSKELNSCQALGSGYQVLNPQVAVR